LLAGKDFLIKIFLKCKKSISLHKIGYLTKQNGVIEGKTLVTKSLPMVVKHDFNQLFFLLLQQKSAVVSIAELSNLYY